MGEKSDWKDELRGHREHILNLLMGGAVIAGAIPIGLGLLRNLQGLQTFGVDMPYYALYFLVVIAFFARRIDHRIRAGLLAGVVYMLGTYLTVSNGIGWTGVWYLLAGPSLLFVLIGRRLGVAAAVISTLAFLIIGLLHFGGALAIRRFPNPLDSFDFASIAVTFLMIIVIISWAQWLFDRARERAARDAYEKNVALIGAQAELEANADHLNAANAQLREQAARLERQTRYLGFTASVAREASTASDVGDLIAFAVDSLWDRFELAHAALYLVEGGQIVLRAEAGTQNLPESARSFEAGGDSVIATCVLDAESLTDDVINPYRPPDPALLPDADAFAAVPLRAGAQVTGALLVQGTISDEDVEMFASLSDELAIALENARLRQDSEARLHELEEAYERQAQLSDAVRRLSTPVIPVWDEVLVVPIIGIVDSARASDIMENLLGGIIAHQADRVILDLTALPAVDADAAHTLTQTINSAEMLGAQVIVVGICSAVARSMADLGFTLDDVTVLANLREGIRYALGRMGLEVVAAERGTQ
jgi:anti-anti-sigma regulatory factor